MVYRYQCCRATLFFNAASGKKFDAAPAPTLLCTVYWYQANFFLKQTQVALRVEATFPGDFCRIKLVTGKSVKGKVPVNISYNLGHF
jgi:hypothetical protein